MYFQQCKALPVKIKMVSDKCKTSAASAGKRKRDRNFTAEEGLLLQELVMRDDNLSIINDRLNNDLTNKKKRKVWEDISTQVSNLGFCERSPLDCSTRWQIIKRKAKEVYTDDKLERMGNGGGPKTIHIKESQMQVIDTLKDNANFSWIRGGLDTDEPGMYLIIHQGLFFN